MTPGKKTGQKKAVKPSQCIFSKMVARQASAMPITLPIKALIGIIRGAITNCFIMSKADIKEEEMRSAEESKVDEIVGTPHLVFALDARIATKCSTGSFYLFFRLMELI